LTSVRLLSSSVIPSLQCRYGATLKFN